MRKSDSWGGISSGRQKRTDLMTCRECGVDNVHEFRSEIAIHFPDPNGYKHPHVFVFPLLLVCSDCGFTEFALDEQVLRQIHEGPARPKGIPHRG
jgi:ribosomal protein L37E